MDKSINTILTYLEYPFVQNAIIVALLISFSSAILGVILVSKRYSFIGDGLSHVGFGAISLAAVIGLINDMLIVLPLTIIAAIAILKRGQSSKIKGDASIAILSTSSMALGYLLMNVFRKSLNVSADVCSTLFGSTSILTLSDMEVKLSIILTSLSLFLFLLFYKRIFAMCFDEAFAKSCGIKTDIYNFFFALITAIIVVVSMKLVGTLMISALIIFPSLTSMKIFSSFKSVTIFSAFISIFATLTGIICSLIYSTPIGATIVMFDVAVYLLGLLFTKILSAKRRHRDGIQ